MEQRLDQLSDGACGVIDRLQLDDPKTKHRYTTLGLTQGASVTKLFQAPSGDPIAIRIRGYVLSLRKQDAEKITLKRTSASNIKTKRFFTESAKAQSRPIFPLTHTDCTAHCGNCRLHARKKARSNTNECTVTAVLAGNPNSGKTTLFNMLTGAHASVGNFPGVTVEKREGTVPLATHMLRIVDLPGIYSITHDTAEELAARSFLLSDRADLIINIVDACTLERNLLLTLELCSLKRPMILVLNMMDEAEARGIDIDCTHLSKLIGIPVIPICARKKIGFSEFLQCIEDVCKRLPNNRTSTHCTSPVNADEAYEKIDEIVSQCVKSRKHDLQNNSDQIDRLLTHRIWGIPIFFAVMACTFLLTFDTLGAYLSDGMDRMLTMGLQPQIEKLLHATKAPPLLSSFIESAIIGGIGSVLTFLPQVALLFLFLSLLEDSGYLARAAFLTDRGLRSFGLSGKACVPMLMGFGCTVPAALATRTMEQDCNRKATLFLLPYISCSAKLPVYGMLASTFFFQHRGLVVLSLYLLGIGMGALVGTLLQGMVFKSDSSPFILELPPYRFPTAKNTLRKVAEHTEHFLRRAGTLIFVMNILLWALLHIDGRLHITTDVSKSMLGRFGTWISPIFEPLGFGNWQASVALLTGLAAKEAVTASLALFTETGGILHQNVLTSIFTPASAYAFLVFVLLSIPCAAAVSTLAQEWKDRRCTILFLLLQSGVAYLTAYVIYTILKILL